LELLYVLLQCMKLSISDMNSTFLNQLQYRPGQAMLESRDRARAVKGIFIGYDGKRDGCWKVKTLDGRIISSRDVQLNEHEFSVGRDPQVLQGQLEKEEAAVRQGSADGPSDSRKQNRMIAAVAAAKGKGNIAAATVIAAVAAANPRGRIQSTGERCKE